MFAERKQGSIIRNPLIATALYCIQVRLSVLAGEMRVAHRATKYICASSPLRSAPVGAKQSSPGRLAPAEGFYFSGRLYSH